ncbi:MAG: hypothetical protein B6245_12500 [Desulfobacteraceae bacterium 4572_88]|nr:MAG: hypothetical protein B6245_12500 [Desulfobacteraceae bacterium 4572_88]
MQRNQKYDLIRRSSGEAEEFARRRREYLAIALRKAKPGSGSHHSFLRKRTLTHIVTDPGKILHRTPFVVVGGVATRLYMPERVTLDLDILIAVEDMLTAEKELRLAGCQKQSNLSIGTSSWRLPDRTVLDMIVSDAPWTEEAIRHPRIAADALPYIDLPYLILMKLHSGRVQDLADISRMLGGADGDSLRTVRTVIGKYLPDDTEDLESLILLGKLEADPRLE